jgi:hypothetical protein
MNPILLTFPRCGSFYLQQLIYQNTGIMLPKTHIIEESDLKFPISIIRNPKDSIKSMIAMELHYNKDYKFDINILTNFYIDLISYLINNESFLIKYDDLLKNSNEVTKAVCSFLGENIEGVSYKNVLVDMKEYKHLISSKKSDMYSKFYISENDLFEANLLYIRALNNCISI